MTSDNVGVELGEEGLFIRRALARNQTTVDTNTIRGTGGVLDPNLNLNVGNHVGGHITLVGKRNDGGDKDSKERELGGELHDS